MTVDLCAMFAQKGNDGARYKSFSVEYSSECYVGNTLMPSGRILTETLDPPRSSCNMKCSGKDSPDLRGPWFALFVLQLKLHSKLGSSPKYRQLPRPRLSDGFPIYAGLAVSGCRLLLLGRQDRG